MAIRCPQNRIASVFFIFCVAIVTQNLKDFRLWKTILVYGHAHILFGILRSQDFFMILAWLCRIKLILLFYEPKLIVIMICWCTTTK